MSTNEAREAAEILWSAWQEKRLIGELPESCRPRDLTEGYAIQNALGDLGGPPLGWKLAATSKAGQAHINVDAPLAGRLYQRFAYPTGATLPASHLHMRVGEAEFAFRMGRALPPRDRLYEREEVMDAVATMHLAIEVPDSRYRDFGSVGAPQLVADHACAAYFVLGPEAAGWRGLDLTTHAVSVSKNGAIVATGRGANVLGDPWTAMVWIANDLAGRGGGLRDGEVVTTGTCVPPYAIEPGDSVVADFGTLGQVAVQFRD